MKIEVKLEVSENNGSQTFSLEDLNLTQLEWDLLSYEDKRELIQQEVFNSPNQPYWILDSFEEK